MLSKVKTLSGYTLHARDGEIGTVKDLYFDDRHWTIRYLVAETGTWLNSRQVLISPYALGGIVKGGKDIAVDLTKKQIENSPPLDADKPVSRQFENEYYAYYDWPIYYGGLAQWGNSPSLERDIKNETKAAGGGKAWDAHLRSTHDVCGHVIQASDGEVGHVEDFLVDDDTWAIRYLIVNTKNWWPGKKVLVSPQWLERVSWSESKVYVNLTRERIKQSPAYADKLLLTRDYETGLYFHYNRKGYWFEQLIGV